MLKKRENNNIFKILMKSITKATTKSIQQYKSISNYILMIIINLNDENSQNLLNMITSTMKEICDPSKYDLLK